MPKKVAERDRFVVPGSRLGVIEEFTAGRGTYESDGVIYSQNIGSATISPSRNVSVAPENSPTLPSEGENIIGIVANVHEKMAVIEIIKLEDRLIPMPFTGFLQISASSPRYEISMTDVCRANDLIRAKVASMSDGIIRLMTIGNNLGVLKAYCSNCGHHLTLRRKVLKCERCNNVEKRKLAEDYSSLG